MNREERRKLLKEVNTGDHDDNDMRSCAESYAHGSLKSNEF